MAHGCAAASQADAQLTITRALIRCHAAGSQTFPAANEDGTFEVDAPHLQGWVEPVTCPPRSSDSRPFSWHEDYIGRGQGLRDRWTPHTPLTGIQCVRRATLSGTTRQK